MKRYLVVLAALCSLLLVLAASPAFAGGSLLGPGSPGQSVSNSTDQSNEAGAANVPIVSGNNAAVVNGGDQSSQAGTTQEQGNVNATGQSGTQTAPAPALHSPAPCSCVGGDDAGQAVQSSTEQENEAGAANAPIASGNNVAVVNAGDQSSQAGTTQGQGNGNVTGQQAAQSGSGTGSDQSVKNETGQENEAGALNAPILSGNNVAVVNEGDQTSSAGTTQKQANGDATGQTATQNGTGGGYGSDQSAKNRTKQENEAGALNAPILSGNNVAVVNKGDQRSSVGTKQEQANGNATDQTASQSSSGDDSGSDQSVRNRTKQENEALAINVPIASGNNVALVNEGDQRSSAGTTQKQLNADATRQTATQSSGGSLLWCGPDQSVRNSTKQENEAFALNVPIASGNNVAFFNGGDQRSSVGTKQEQLNANATGQRATQDDHGAWFGPGQSVRNRTEQENEAYALNAPILSGNDVALVNGYGDCHCTAGGGQSSSAGVEQRQANLNLTRQTADQSGSGGALWQSVSNRTEQENEAYAANVPILSGNNLAFVNGGSQRSSVGTSQEQFNGNATRQSATQTSLHGGNSPCCYERQCCGSYELWKEVKLR